MEQTTEQYKIAPHKPEIFTGYVASGREMAMKFLFASFRSSQGDQPAQINDLQAAVRRHIELGNAFDVSEFEDEGAEKVAEDLLCSLNLPKGHRDIANHDHIKAEFKFWWQIFGDTIRNVADADPDAIRSRSSLRQLAWDVGGTPEMSSFSAKEITGIMDEMEPYRSKEVIGMSSLEIIEKFVIPRRLRVEIEWQEDERKRRDSNQTGEKADQHASVLMDQILDAGVREAKGQALNVRQQLYLDEYAILMTLATENPESKTAEDLNYFLELYRHNHEGKQPLAFGEEELFSLPA